MKYLSAKLTSFYRRLPRHGIKLETVLVNNRDCSDILLTTLLASFPGGKEFFCNRGRYD